MKNFQQEETPVLAQQRQPMPNKKNTNMKHRRRLSQLEGYQNEEGVKLVLANLSEEEIDTAARACYPYVQHPSPQTQSIYASRICKRYLDSKHGDVEVATQKVKKTLQFREEYDLEGLMTAFDNDNEYADPLQKHLADEKFLVQGYDMEGRSTLFFVPRHTKGFDKEWHLKEALYSIERAIACSKAKDHTINAIVDFSGFSLTKHSPPMDLAKQFLTTLRSHFAGQINKIYLLDCPTSFSFLWTLFSPFIGTTTWNKITFISGRNKKQLAGIYDLEEMPCWLCPGGSKDRPFDLDEYLFDFSFDEAFDER